MAITVNGKTYRNIQEQVAKNQEDIAKNKIDILENDEAISDLQELVSHKQNTLTAGDGINITNDEISVDSNYVMTTNTSQTMEKAGVMYKTIRDTTANKSTMWSPSGIYIDNRANLQATSYAHGYVETYGNVNFHINQYGGPNGFKVYNFDNSKGGTVAVTDDIPAYTTSRGIVKTGNNLALEGEIYQLKDLIYLNGNGKTVLATPSGFTYVKAMVFDPDATYYARTRIPVDPTKAKGTWIIDEDWDPSDFAFGISGSYYFVGGNSPDASKSRGYSIIKNSSGWVMYNYYDVVVSGNNSMQAYPINGGWGENARNLGIPNETSVFDGMLAHCTKFSEKVLGVDAENMEALETVSYEYTEVEVTEETFVPDTYYVIQTSYTEVLLEDIIAAIGGN